MDKSTSLFKDRNLDDYAAARPEDIAVVRMTKKVSSPGFHHIVPTSTCTWGSSHQYGLTYRHQIFVQDI